MRLRLAGAFAKVLTAPLHRRHTLIDLSLDLPELSHSLHGHYPTASLLRDNPPLFAALVLSASRDFRLRLFPYCHRTGSQVRRRSLNQVHAAFMPEPIWAVSRLPESPREPAETFLRFLDVYWLSSMRPHAMVGYGRLYTRSTRTAFCDPPNRLSSAPLPRHIFVRRREPQPDRKFFFLTAFTCRSQRLAAGRECD